MKAIAEEPKPDTQREYDSDQHNGRQNQLICPTEHKTSTVHGKKDNTSITWLIT